MKKIFSLILVLISFTTAFAQTAEKVEMADVLRSSGKIYVVILTLVIVFVGITIYLFSIDRRLKKIEREK